MTQAKIDIVVAEDDNQVAELLQAIFENEGLISKRLEDGMAARQYIAANNEPPRLVLLDIMMPYVDGFQLVTEIRANPTWASVPIAMLTAKTEQHDVIRAIKAGANEYIVKPFQPGELIARIKRIMGH